MSNKNYIKSLVKEEIRLLQKEIGDKKEIVSFLNNIGTIYNKKGSGKKQRSEEPAVG